MSALAEQSTPLRPGRSTGRWVLVFLLASFALHAGALGWMSLLPDRELAKTNEPVELVMFEVEPPKPPEPEPEPEKAPEPEPPKPVVKPKPPPIKVATVKELPVEPPPEDAPPPPNEEAPPEAPPAKPVLITGISMSSTTSAGTFSAPVGNTAYGKMADKATDPNEVKAYRAKRYAPIYQVDRQPSVLSEVKVPYPDEAKRAGIEGTVTLAITIDENGDVVAAKVLDGPGYGLNEAALKAIRRYKFRPATKGGESVATDLKFAYTFLLD